MVSTRTTSDEVTDLLSALAKHREFLRYAVAADTAALVRSLPNLDDVSPLPQAPWFDSGGWSARRVLLHVLAETAQHAGHADILRETIDGQKTMG